MADPDLSLVETSDGLQVILNGRALYGSNPRSSSAAKAERIQLQTSTLYLLASPAAWHGVEHLLGRLPESSRIIAIETDLVLLELARRLRPSTLDPDTVALAADAREIMRVLHSENPRGPGAFRRVRQVSFSRSAALSGPAYREIRETIERDIRTHWQNRLTLSAMGRLWTGNLVRNLPLVPFGSPFPATGKPVVVCGAGPSLDSSISFIRAVRADATVVAVDSALPCLAGHGITPDFVVAVEAQFSNLYDFVPVPRTSYRLIADLTSSPAVAHIHETSSVSWFMSRFAESPFLERVTRAGFALLEVPPLGSVGVTAVFLALRMTASHLFLCGLDFSFRGRTHAAGAPSQISALLKNDRLNRAVPPELVGRHIRRTGRDGQPVLSSLTLIGYAEQLDSIVRPQHTAGVERGIYAVDPMGIATAPRPVTAAEARSLVGAAGTPAGAAEGSAAGGDASVPDTEKADRVARLLEDELARLGNLSDSLDRHFTGRESTDLKSRFTECSYVAADFPDFSGEFSEEAPFLNRVAVAVDYYRARCERSLRSLRS